MATDKKLNILYMLPELNVGGVETHVLSLALGMKEMGHNVIVISNGGALAPRLEEGGVEHVVMPVHHKSPVTVNEQARRVRELIERRGIHVVHAHSRVPAWIGHFATRRLRAAFIISAHGQYAAHMGSRVMAWGDHIICVSDIIREHMRARLKADPARMSTVYNGIDMDEALERLRSARNPADMRASLGIPADAPVAGHIGRLTVTKGTRFFLDAMASLVKKRPEVRALVVGDGQLRKELQDRATELGIASNVIFTGMRTDVYDILNILDVYVVSSLSEGFPMGCLEAMSVRVPIVATGVGGIPEMLSHEQTALLADARDTDALAAHMDRLLDDPDLRARLTDAGFDTVSSKFSRQRMLQEVLDVYTRTLRTKYGLLQPVRAASALDRPRVLLALPELEVGGVETHVIDLAIGLKRRGYEPIVASNGGKLVEKLATENILHVEAPIHSKAPPVIASMVGRMRQVIRENRIELVHAHSRVPAWICYLAMRGEKGNRPFVTTCHSTYSVHVGSQVMTWGDSMIAVSSFVRQHMLRNFGTAPDRITTVYNGVSPDLYDAARGKDMAARYKSELGLDNGTRVVGMVASLTPRKGYAYFIRAAQAILAQYPNVVFLGVGGGVQKDELESMAREAGLDSRFRFLGVRQDVRDLMYSFDIFVLSSMSEGLPYVILEAMCMKKPIVSTNVGGIPEAIEHGANGLLVPPKDVDALSHSILSLLEDTDQARALGEAAHRRIADSFSVEKMVDQTEQIYMAAFG